MKHYKDELKQFIEDAQQINPKDDPGYLLSIFWITFVFWVMDMPASWSQDDSGSNAEDLSVGPLGP